MLPAFCLQTSLHRPPPFARTQITCKQRRSTPPSQPRQTPRSPRAKRPRPSTESSGFSTTTSSSSPSAPEESPEKTPTAPAPTRDLTKRDAFGISMEDRLREEIQHPLRKPKLTLYGTLAFSATLGMFFAMGRASKDGLSQVTQNIVIDIAAISLFGYLAWREVLFGRRALNSIAGCPQARDLKVVMLEEGDTGTFLGFGGGRVKRIGDLMAKDLVVVAGRGVDVTKYLELSSSSGGNAIVVFVTDTKGEQSKFEGAVAVASGESEHAKDWGAWLGDAVPPRRNVALFRIDQGDGGMKAASAYVVGVGLPTDLPLPVDARRKLTEI